MCSKVALGTRPWSLFRSVARAADVPCALFKELASQPGLVCRRGACMCALQSRQWEVISTVEVTTSSSLSTSMGQLSPENGVQGVDKAWKTMPDCQQEGAPQCTGGKARKSRSVAVIGGGAAGLVAAKELLQEGHRVTVFEQGDTVGGVWVYDEATEEDDLLGVCPDRDIVHSSMYASLRTNLPREVMSFADFHFLPSDKPGRDPRRFPTHAEVKQYLHDYATVFDLWPHIRLQSRVSQVKRGEQSSGWQRWLVASGPAKAPKDKLADKVIEGFDAVIVCTGHFTQPRIAKLPGMEQWPGKQLHSHNYRTPAGYQGQVVVVIGAGSSGEDISREVAEVASEVYLCASSWEVDPIDMPSNLHRKPHVSGLDLDGLVKFTDGSSTYADVILHCTGYEYEYPFLEGGLISSQGGRVEPLYEHVFVPHCAPTLAFMGLPFKVTPLPLFEVTGRWIAAVLSGAAELPSAEEMLQWQEDYLAQLQRKGVQRQHSHKLAGAAQWEYFSRIASYFGGSEQPSWRRELYERTGQNKRAHPVSYRDHWPQEDEPLLIKEAWADMQATQRRIVRDGVK